MMHFKLGSFEPADLTLQKASQMLLYHEVDSIWQVRKSYGKLSDMIEDIKRGKLLRGMKTFLTLVASSSGRGSSGAPVEPETAVSKKRGISVGSRTLQEEGIQETPLQGRRVAAFSTSTRRLKNPK